MAKIAIKRAAGAGGNQILLVPDAPTRLALPVSEGLLVLQLDLDELWEYDLGTASWVRLAGIEAANPYTFAGYNGVGECRPIPYWQYIDLPLQIAHANIGSGATIPNTVTSYDTIRDSSNVDGNTLASHYGYTLWSQFGNTVATTITSKASFADYSVYGANATLSNYFGLHLNPIMQTGSVGGGFSLALLNPQLDVTGGGGFRAIDFSGSFGLNSATDFNNWIDMILNPHFGQFMNLVSGWIGFQITPTFDVGSVSGGVYQCAYIHPVIDTAVLSGYNGLFISPTIGTIGPVALTNFNGITLNTVLGAGLTLQNYSELIIRPNTQVGASIVNNAWMIDIGFNAATPIGGSVIGVNIDLTNAQTATQKVGVNVTDAALVAYSNWNTSVLPASPGFMQQHALGGQFNVAAGSPMTNTLSSALNFGQVAIFLDDMGPDAFGGFIGRTDLFMASQISIDAGKTVDTYNNVVFAASVPVTGVSGGTLVNATNVKIGGFLPQGFDTISITNLYGVHIMSIFNSFGATNAWGIFVDDSTVDNYFSKSISINTVAKKSAAGVGLEIYQKDFLLDQGELWAYDPSATGFKVVVKAPVLAADTLFALPPTNGNAGEQLTTDGAGNTSWSNVQVPNVQNPPAAAQAVTNATTIVIDPTRQKNIVFVTGNGGAVVVDAVTGITDGTFDGQECIVVGMDDTNTVEIDSVGNMELNGSVVLGYHDSISFIWDNTNAVWFEVSRS